MEDIFEFEALAAAANYRARILGIFRPHLGGTTLEIGSGVGQFSRMLLQEPTLTRLICVEPSPSYLPELQALQGPVDVFTNTIHELDPSIEPDSIVSINVLEHIEEDEKELQAYADRLTPKGGAFCLFTPAGPELYAPLDQRFGHFRRYRRNELIHKLHTAGFQVEFCRYFNFPGYFLWWLEFKMLRQQHFNVRKVEFFDRWLFPLIAGVEAHIPPPLGQSLVAVATRPKG